MSGRVGAYLLLLSAPSDAAIAVGKLGRLDLRSGNYVYVGSAMGGLEARLSRHFRRHKTVRWHIDYLLGRMTLAGAVLFPSGKKEECALARMVQAHRGAIPVDGVGCSDCHCQAHLFYIGKRSFGPLLMHLDRRRWQAEGLGLGGR